MALQTNIDTLVMGAVSAVKKGVNEYLEQIPGKPSLTEIQKILLTSRVNQ